MRRTASEAAGADGPELPSSRGMAQLSVNGHANSARQHEQQTWPEGATVGSPVGMDTTGLAGDSSGTGEWRWEAVEQLVVYGLGSPEGSAVPRYQLAFALLLAAQLPGLAGPVLAFDPAFTDVDRQLLATLDIQVQPGFSLIDGQ